MSILIKTVRIAGFRGLENIEVALIVNLSHRMIFLFREVQYLGQ